MPDAIGDRRSAIGGRRSALGARRSALGVRRSALGARLAASLLAVSLGALAAATETARPSQAAARAPQRIVSLIPAVTEMLFAIGAGPRVVAVSSFDTYPPDVETLPRVGALVDPDLERILSLRPDLVVVYGSQSDLRAQLERAGVATYVYEHAGLADVTSTIRRVGARVGQAEAAAALAASIERQLAAIRARTAERPRPRTLIVMGRESGALRGIYASGGVGFIHDMVTAAGGDNVFGDIRQQAVQATAELILARRPEVILELRVGTLSADEIARETAAWRALSSLPAVRDHRIVILTDPRTVIPGPRVAEGTEAIERVLRR
jgi:ABC-type Fe3+-hydroxamate transport system substrate-binding protein